MRKTFFALVVLAVISLDVTGQIGAQEGGSAYGNSLRVIEIKSDKAGAIEGTPYLNEQFKRGKLFIKGKDTLNVFLRYDVVKERMEIKTDPSSSDVYTLPLDANATFWIGSEKYVVDRIAADGETHFGYFNEKFDGDKYSLFEKATAEYIPPVKARTGYDEDEPARIELDKVYFLIENGSAKKVDIKHRDIRRALESKEAKQYLKDHRIRDEKDLLDLLQYLEQ